MDLDILCPECEDSVMVEENGMRVCKECGHEMTLFEYHILLSERFSEVDNMMSIPNAVERRNFGKTRAKSVRH